jgi:CheY-like chemotaxis protein
VSVAHTSAGKDSGFQLPRLCRVLVVDDEATNRRLVQRMLQRMHCESVCLEDGDEIEGALLAAGYTMGDKARAELGGGSPAPTKLDRFDVILLDIMMRRTIGVDVLVELKKKFANSVPPLPPVVAMTGNTSLQDMMMYKDAGFVHLLGKPFDNEGLKTALRVSSKSH